MMWQAVLRFMVLAVLVVTVASGVGALWYAGPAVEGT